MVWPIFPEKPVMKGFWEMEACRYSVLFRVGKRYFLKSEFLKTTDIKGFIENRPPRQNVSQFGIIPCLYSVFVEKFSTILRKTFEDRCTTIRMSGDEILLPGF